MDIKMGSTLLIFGLLLGWLAEWAIDWVYWRGPRQEKTPEEPRKLTTSELQAHVQKIKSLGEALGGTLSGPAVKGASAEVADYKMKIGLASWFDDVMDRSSGEYKRRASKWSLLFGVILACTFNVDSIAIATRMWREPTLRQVIVANANDYYPNTKVPMSPNEFVDQFNKQIDIPIGWTSTTMPKDGKAWLLKIFGLLISGLAAAQGAPFWFDILKKLVNVRSSGVSPKNSHSDEPNIS